MPAQRMTGYFEVYTKRPRDVLDRRWQDLLYRERWSVLQDAKLVLDVGFGWGLFLATAPDGVRVVAFDLDDEALGRGRERYPAYRFVRGDASRLPFRDAAFDGVHCSHVIEHLGEPETLAREVFRVLRPGGVAMIVTPDIERCGFHFYVDHTHRHPFTRESLAGMLRVVGFYIESLEYGIFHNTRVDVWMQRALRVPLLWVYRVRKRLGQWYGGELICVVRKPHPNEPLRG